METLFKYMFLPSFKEMDKLHKVIVQKYLFTVYSNSKTLNLNQKVLFKNQFKNQKDMFNKCHENIVFTLNQFPLRTVTEIMEAYRKLRPFLLPVLENHKLVHQTHDYTYILFNNYF